MHIFYLQAIEARDHHERHSPLALILRDACLMTKQLSQLPDAPADSAQMASLKDTIHQLEVQIQ